VEEGGDGASASLVFSIMSLRRDAKLSMMPPSSLLFVSSKTPSKDAEAAARERSELAAAVKLGSS
jgi:hypothetical protein